MIRFVDAFVLAQTKLKTRKIRTGITVAVSAVLFGCLLAVIMIMQGVFSSVESFSRDGLGDRYLVQASRVSDTLYDPSEYLNDREFIAKVKAEYTTGIKERTEAAKQLQIAYDPTIEDPSPVTIDPETKEETIDYSGMSHWAVVPFLQEIAKQRYEPFDIKKLAAPYSPKAIYDTERPIAPTTGTVVYMQDGKEEFPDAGNKRNARLQASGNGWIESGDQSLSIVEQSIAAPFLLTHDIDVSDGTIPVIIPFAKAEKLLDMEPLSNNATNQQRKQRVDDVRARIVGKMASFCYRNNASQGLIDETRRINQEIEKNKHDAQYVKPALVYELPDEDTCGAAKIASDTRTTMEKTAAANRQKFDEQFNGATVPTQRKLNVRVVGMSPGSTVTQGLSGIGELVASMFGSTLSDWWVIPSDYFEALPSDLRASEIFTEPTEFYGNYARPESAIIEFSTYHDAQAFLKKYGCMYGDCGSRNIWTMPMSSTLLVAEMKQVLRDAIFWMVIIVSVVAAIIMAGTIGRTIADGRKEAAVFRAIGAKRSDITGIYTTYTVFLAVRVAVFALLLGIAIALCVQLWVGADATLGAQLVFNTVDNSKQFWLIGFATWYIPAIVGIILLTSLVAAVVPLLRNVRRSPIKDMRDDA